MTAATAAAAAEDVARAIAGTGGPIGVTVDGQAVPIGSGQFPRYRWGLAPAGLATRRQLATCGLRPGGVEPVARLEWRGGRRFAELYRLDCATPKRPMTPARWAALAAAMCARRTCASCGRDAGYVIPSSLGRCLDCLNT